MILVGCCGVPRNYAAPRRVFRVTEYHHISCSNSIRFPKISVERGGGHHVRRRASGSYELIITA